MATKRKPLYSSNSSTKLNFRPNVSDSIKWETKGTKPVQEPSSIPKVLLIMILHGCRKIVFVNTNLKVCIYLLSLFIISLLADVLPFPKTYFSHKDNIFNQYFVKMAWGWTLLLSVPFVMLTSTTYCCGNKDRIVKHMIRLAVATISWFLWVKFFSFVEGIIGRCNAKGDLLKTKSTCAEKGYHWQGFDISGHAFILIYSTLVLIEEARAIIGWEGINDMIRNEEYIRSSGNNESSNNLKKLSDKDLKTLKVLYEKNTPYIRFLFIMITFLIIIWDCMLLSTILYFHSMVEKFISGCVAVSIWLLTYRFWFTIPKYFSCMPGEGLFKYGDLRYLKETSSKKTTTNNKGQLPKFMGMPLLGLRNEIQFDKSDLKTENGFTTLNTS
uniref:FIT family protein n=1 Tax=Clastoptera arizonana TaxID=38151 RepID=A0A1B6CYR3_9HEMI